jgi:serine/threonine protein kinase/WD40 repeat protein
MNTQEFELFLAELYASARSSGVLAAIDDAPSVQKPARANASDSPEIFRFGPFELVVELGRGGFGIVYLARDSRCGRDVALKLPMPFVLISQIARNRFLREGRVGETLDHQGIVKVLETGEFGGIVYIASEFVSGPTLLTWLAERKSPVPPRIAAMLVARMADALAHAHAKGVIHRDLKPANVLLRPSGASGATGSCSDCPFQPCVTDFGLAKVLHEIRDEQTMTGSAEIGSTAYMAPEQAIGDSGSIGPCTDIHALGAILYRILAGQNPFRGQTREEVLRKIMQEPPQLLRSIRPDIPEQLETICDKCLRKDPHKRYASAESLKADLERFLVSEKIHARPMTYWEKGRNWVRRHPAITAAGVSAVAFLVVVIVSQAIQNRNLKRINRDLEISERRAEEQAQLAETRKAIVDQSYYETRLNSAQSLAKIGLVERAQQALTEIDPGPGRRDFAWNHLSLLSREEMEVLAFADSDQKLLAISPDGTALATSDKARAVVLRDIATGAESDRFDTVGESVEFLRFSRDGRRLFCVSKVTTNSGRSHAREYVFVTRENRNSRIARIRPNSGQSLSDYVESAAGDRIRFVISGDSRDPLRIGFLSIRDLRFGQESVQRSPKFARLSPDGRNVVLADESGMIRLISFDKANVDRLFVPTREVLPNSISIDRDSGNLGITDKNRRSIRILRLDSDSRSKPIRFELPFEVEASRWIEGQVRLLVYDTRWKAAVIDPRSGSITPLRSAEDPGPDSFRLDSSAQVRGVAVGSRLLTYGYVRNPGGRIHQVWDLESGQERPFPFRESIVDARTMPDGKSVLLANGRLIKRWWPGGRTLSNRTLEGHSDEAWGACFAPDDSVLVTGSDDSDDRMTLRFWDWKNGRLIRGFAPHKATVSCVEFSPDGRMLATCSLSDQENLAIWDSNTGSKIVDLAGHSTSVYNLAFSSDGTRLVSGDNKGVVIVWDVSTGKALSRIEADRDRIRGLSFMPGSRTVFATASESRHVRVWDSSDDRLLRDWETGGEMTSLAFVPGEARLCAAESSGRLFFWNIDSGELIRLIEGGGFRIRHMRFLPASTILAAGDVNGALHLWNVETGIETLNLKGHETPINRVACSSDGKTIATVAHDGSVRLWFGGETP